MYHILLNINNHIVVYGDEITLHPSYHDIRALDLESSRVFFFSPSPAKAQLSSPSSCFLSFLFLPADHPCSDLHGINHTDWLSDSAFNTLQNQFSLYF